MSISSSILRFCRHAAALMTLVLAACDDFEDLPLEPTGVEDATDGLALMPPGPVGSTGADAMAERPGEATFVQIASVEPSFAGFFVEGDQLVVLATSGPVGSTGGTDGGGGSDGPGGGVPDSISSTGGDGSTGSTGVPANVEASLRELVSVVSVVPPGDDVSSVSIREADYSFPQLSAWRELLEPTIWNSDDVVSLDLDERFNRLTVELETGTGEAEIRAAARLLDVPDAALGFEVSGEVSVASATPDIVRSRVRPLRGGYYISTSGADGCTYGFNAVRAIEGDTVAVTNSHCTTNEFQMDGDSAWQKDYTRPNEGFTPENFIGTEISDPGPIPCNSRRQSCRLERRRSDAAAFRLKIPRDSIGLYQIARTRYRHHGTSLPGGSLAIDSISPYFTIHGEWPSPTAGNELNKIGVETGWTYGVVIKTCATVNPADLDGNRFTVTCGYKMNARSDYGDSGSPVFYWDGEGDEVVLAGLVFGTNTNTKKAWFSSMAAIEHDLGNLRTAAPTTPTKPDLTVSSVSADDSGVKPGAGLTLSATVENDGGVGAAATTLTYYRSTDATITTKDTFVGSDTVSALAAGGISNESIGLTAPSSESSYYYGACITAVSGETRTSNNCSSSATVVVTTALDLTVSSVSVSDSIIEPATSFTLSATVENEGGVAAAATTLIYYRSGNSTISIEADSVGAATVGALAASGTSDQSISLTAPSSRGTVYYGACVASVTGEADKADNCSSAMRVDVEASGPDLVVVSASVSESSMEPSTSFTLSATVQNDGDEEAAATTLTYYRSIDSTISTSDTSVGTDTVRALAAGGDSDESISLTAPSAAGTYYYGACVAPVTGEVFTTENCSLGVSVVVE